MVKIKEGVSLRPAGDLYIRRELRKLADYEHHMASIAEAEKIERELAEKEHREPRKPTKAEVSVRKMAEDKMEKIYRAFDGAVEIAPEEDRETIKRLVRARLVENDQPLYFERDDAVLTECIERAKIIAFAYLREDARTIMLDEE